MATRRVTHRRANASTRAVDWSSRGRASGPHAYVTLLGLEMFDLPDLLRVLRVGLPYRAIQRFQRNTMLPLERVLAVLGVSSRTLARRRRERRFSTDESDRVLRVARLFAKVLELYEGDRDGAATWVTTGQLVVGRCTPLDLARTELGAREVERLVGRLQQGVFS